MTFDTHGIKTKMVMVRGATGAKGADGGTFSYPIHGATKAVYVDGQNGDDTAAGTSTAPLKTLRAALDLLDTTTPKLEIHFKTAGTYEFTSSGRLVGGARLSLIGDVSGVIVNPRYWYDVINCYFALNNITFVQAATWTFLNSIVILSNATIQGDMAMRGGRLEATGSTFTGSLNFHGGTFNVESSVVHVVDCRTGANGVFSNITVDGEPKTKAALYIREGSSAVCSGSFTIQELSAADTHDVVSVFRGTLNWGATVTDNTVEGRKYAYGIHVNIGTLIGGDPLASLEALGTYYTNSASLIVKTRQILDS